MASWSQRNRVFISYSHRDAGYLARLHTHLAYYEHEGLIDYWDDTQLSAGDDWKRKITQAIEQARLCILLVSADYLASSYVVDNELPHILARARNDGVQIVQVILSPCAFKHTELGQFQALNDASRPLSGMSRHNREKVWETLTYKVVDVLREAQSEAQSSQRFSLLQDSPLFELASASTEMSIEDALSYGSRLIEEGKYSEAAAILREPADLTPENFRSRFLYGVALLKLAQNRKANEQLTQAFKLEYRQSTVIGTILVVDDDPSTRSLFRVIIEDVMPGYAVSEAPDGVKALAKLSRTEPALLVLDYMMPRMNGLEVLHRLADRGERYPVIFTSAHTLDAADVAKRTGYPARQVTFLSKPFEPMQLETMVVDMINRGGLR